MASVYTNKQDYAVGETVKIAGTDFTSGRTVEFKIINFGADGIKGTGDDINYVAWSVLVGSNGTISAVWEVPEDAQNSKLELTATEDTDGDGVFGGAGDVTATTMFTDAFGSTLSQYANDLDTAGNRQYQTGSLNDINSDYVEGDSIPFRYLIADAQEGGRVHLDIVYQFTNTAGDNTYDFLTSDNASVTLTDAIRFGANSASIPAGFGLTSSTNLLNVAIPDDPNITLDTGGNLRVASNFGVSLVSVSAPTILDNGIEKKISLILDLGSDGDGTLKEGNVDLGVFWGGHLARDNQYAGPDNGAADAPGASFHMKGEGFVDNDGNGTKNAGDDDLGAGDRSLQGGVVVETSLAWEKRAADTNALQGGATFTVTPDPTTGTGSLTVVDDTDGVTSDTDIDRDPNAGQLLLNDLKFGTYTITETVAPAGYSLDPDATRVQTITNTAPNAVVGTQGTNDPGATDESDFHNPVAFVPAPAIQVVKTAGNAVDGTTLTTLAGDVVYHYVVTNTGDVALSDVTVVDDRGTAATGDDVTVGTIASLAAGASQELTATINVTSDTTNVATATGTTPLSGTVSDTDDAVVDVFAKGVGGLTPGFWGQHIEAWDGVLANNDKTQNLVTSGVLSDRDAILYGSSLSLADLNGDGTVNTSDKGVLLGDTNGDGVRGNDGANNYLFVSLAAAQQIILSSETSIDTRQILMKHALATQLNINNGDIQPKDLIGEAVQWLKGQSPYTYTDGSSGQVDTNGNGVLESTEYNTTTKAFTFDANGSTRTGNALTSNLQAWQKDVDVDSTSVNVQANGQDLKNALMYFNQDQLVTVNGGSQVGFTADHVSLIGVPQNNVEDAFWGTLQTAGIIS